MVKLKYYLLMVIYPNTTQKTDIWTITNNEGRRICRRQSDGYTYEIESIPAAIETCPETFAKVLFKEDNVISIVQESGYRYTVHNDGTKILTNCDKTEYIYEKEGYSIVKVLYGKMLDEPESVRGMNESDAESEFYESVLTTRQFFKEKIKDQRIIQTYCHDKSIIQSFVEVNEFENTPAMDSQLNLDNTEQEEVNPEEDKQEENMQMEAEGEAADAEQQPVEKAPEPPNLQATHLIRRQDMSITKVSKDGEICIISGSTRSDLNGSGNKLKIGKDIDYLIELFETRSEERRGGIFTCSLQKQNITTHDRDRNFFAVNSNGTFEKVLAPELSEVDHFEEHMDGDDEDIVPKKMGAPLSLSSRGYPF
jgi:hypothetical protein